jgi:uncharacterized protein (TIGR00730 family)
MIKTNGTADERLLKPPTEEQTAFLSSDPWRVLRIQSEFVKGFDALAHLGKAVTIFGSARTQPDDPMYIATVETARLLGEAGFAIITGGGPGIMQAGNQGAREVGVTSVGLNIELPFEQHINPYTDIDVEFRYFMVRKTMLVKYAQAFVIFPGGFGTLDELMEAITLIQTGKIRNFPLILFGIDYWQGLFDWLRQTVLGRGNISPEDMDLMVLTDSPTEVRDVILAAIEGKSTRIATREEAAVRETARVYAGYAGYATEVDLESGLLATPPDDAE